MRQAIKIKIGSKYGILTVESTGFVKRTNPFDEKKTRRYSYCRCNCGKIIPVDNYNLKGGHSQSCGCMGNNWRKNLKNKIKKI